jgi:hypothetical protein
MSIANPLWGAPRIHGELLKLGIDVGQTSVAKYMVRRRTPPSQGWKTFLRNHADGIAAMDLTDGGLWLGATPSLSDPRLGSCYGDTFVRRVRSLGIRDHPTSARSPWQNGYAERLIGSIRRECLDHIVVVGEQHLRHILMCYLEYYNAVRTHLSLGKDALVRRLIQRAGRIDVRPVLGGLHHQYGRI